MLSFVLEKRVCALKVNDVFDTVVELVKSDSSNY